MEARLAAKQAQLQELEAETERLDGIIAAAGELQLAPDSPGRDAADGNDRTADLEAAGLEIELRSAQAKALALEEQAQRLDAQKRHLESLVAQLDDALGEEEGAASAGAGDGFAEEAPEALPQQEAVEALVPFGAGSSRPADDGGSEHAERLRLLARLQMLLQLEEALDAEEKAAARGTADAHDPGRSYDLDDEDGDGGAAAAAAVRALPEVPGEAAQPPSRGLQQLIPDIARASSIHSLTAERPQDDDGGAASEGGAAVSDEALQIAELQRRFAELSAMRANLVAMIGAASGSEPRVEAEGSKAAHVGGDGRSSFIAEPMLRQSIPAVERDVPGPFRRGDREDIELTSALAPAPTSEADVVGARLRVMQRFLTELGVSLGNAPHRLASGAVDPRSDAPALSGAPLSLSDLMRDESDLAVAGHPRVDLSPAALHRLFRASMNDAVVTALLHRQAQRSEHFGAPTRPPSLVDGDIDAAMEDVAFPAMFRAALMQVRVKLHSHSVSRSRSKVPRPAYLCSASLRMPPNFCALSRRLSSLLKTRLSLRDCASPWLARTPRPKMPRFPWRQRDSSHQRRSSNSGRAPRPARHQRRRLGRHIDRTPQPALGQV